jgi:hypothetical protein
MALQCRLHDRIDPVCTLYLESIDSLRALRSASRIESILIRSTPAPRVLDPTDHPAPRRAERGRHADTAGGACAV